MAAILSGELTKPRGGERMKRISIAVAVVLLVGAVSSWAQTNAFVVSIKGTITQLDGTKVTIKDAKKGVGGLVSPTNLVLVAIVEPGVTTRLRSMKSIR